MFLVVSSALMLLSAFGVDGAHAHDDQRASRQKPGEVFRDCDVCPEMLVVPPGTFLMGAADDNNVSPALAILGTTTIGPVLTAIIGLADSAAADCFDADRAFGRMGAANDNDLGELSKVAA